VLRECVQDALQSNGSSPVQIDDGFVGFLMFSGIQIVVIFGFPLCLHVFSAGPMYGFIAFLVLGSIHILFVAVFSILHKE